MLQKKLAIQKELARNPVGESFSHLAMLGYVNINDIYSQTDRLHGTETLCGDWQGTTLALGQDFAHTGLLRERLNAVPDRNPFHHGQITTNRNLCDFLSPKHSVSIDGRTAKTCGVVYANAIWLLKDCQHMAGRLPCLKQAIEMNAQVLRATIESMPNLDTIICLGKVPYLAVQNLYAFPGNWREDRDLRQWRNVNGIRICAMTHPGQLGINNRAKDNLLKSGRALVAEDYEIALAN